MGVAVGRHTFMRWITGIVIGVLSFVILFTPVVYIVGGCAGFIVGVSIGASATPEQHQHLAETVSPAVQEFVKNHVGLLSLISAVITAGISWFIASKLLGVLPWCRESVSPRQGYNPRAAAAILGGSLPPVVPSKVAPPKPAPSKPAPPVPPTPTSHFPKPGKPVMQTPASPAIPVPPSSPKPVRNPIKDTLYGNLPLDQWPAPGNDLTVSPWAEFDAARNHITVGQTDQAIEIWQTLIATQGLEALHYLQAWHFLRQHGVEPSEEEAKNPYGVISEQGKSGVLVALYLDGQARLYSDDGQSIVWAHPDASLDPMIESILGAAAMLMRKVKQSDPKIDSSRIAVNSISVLTPSGVYTKTGAPGTFEILPLIKPIAEGINQITKALVEKV